MPSLIKQFTALLIAVFAGAFLMYWFQSEGNQNQDNMEDVEQPLYWVAPMDPNYRRDKPGKSAMGMDLIPVYKEGNGEDDVGVIRISAHVVNNLGVRTTKVEAAPLDKKVNTVGYVQYDEDKLVHIHPRVDGWIETLFIKAEGEPVKKGQALYQLYSPQLVNAQEEFLIALKQQNKTLINATRARLEALHMSDSFIQHLEQSLKVENTVTFYAPQSGVIDGLKIREGFFVKPGNTLMTIAQLEYIWVEAEVFERDAASMKEGLAVEMSLDYLPNKRWRGVVNYIYPSLNAKTRTLRVRLKFMNDNLLLKPNMFANVSINVPGEQEMLLVPSEAVIRTGRQNRVVVALGEGQFKSVEVTIGQVNENKTAIITGLNAEDSVVISAQFLIDSESSKDSDFRRMATSQEMTEEGYPSARVDGEVLAIDREQRVITIARDAIEKWQRPAATMDFILDENIDISSLTSGAKVQFTFEVRDDLIIVSLLQNNATDDTKE